MYINQCSYKQYKVIIDTSFKLVLQNQMDTKRKERKKEQEEIRETGLEEGTRIIR